MTEDPRVFLLDLEEPETDHFEDDDLVQIWQRIQAQDDATSEREDTS